MGGRSNLRTLTWTAQLCPGPTATAVRPAMCTVVSASMSTVTTGLIALVVDTTTLQVGPTPSAPQPLDRPHQVILARVRVDHGRHEAAMPGEALREADVLGERVEIGHR
jgi:hypothetical protein